ncbi:aminotransferase class I/II-fold pyridoxal phosphate-dependent enzyme [Roseisolibacter sp. H3M3-2]|uniref:pyridoxal phosphate-dependent aminotransferase n=1 Tax=Roseisolibacter sp. H3M3-2 TaxID=3031323 RepID=UPI0023DAD809|nr:aminotransferase class I/II-fold pyridoxal phosphate-dependent enzyme [Roseisolibacter sp. H3M3-2]MDF1501686.1 aminotransferase class I/II-fold pyridoxal phosphate-dependent enzyme [Roseisolibacter sp. H3M3-2]
MTTLVSTDGRRLSATADALIGSEILKIAGEIRALVAGGRTVCNLTVGDFNPAEFAIPPRLAAETEAALRAGETNYPPSAGMPALREIVAAFYREWLGLDYGVDSVLVTGGARPAIYGVYRALVDPGDRVVYPVPSWNNNHYAHLSGAVGVPVVCDAAHAFLPTREALAPALRGARLLALNSPLNPAGTAFDAGQLAGICDLVLEENARRAGTGERPLYLMYDQVYWMLTFNDVEHVTPVRLRPELAEHTIFVDGISKAFAATGLRVGWAVGPRDVIGRMSDLLGHVGAWAPRAEQVASARLLAAAGEVRAYQAQITRGAQARLDALYAGMRALRDAGHPVEAIPPMGAIYLSVRYALAGRRTPGGETLRTNEDVRRYLLEAAGLAVVPFQAFGLAEDTGWFRLSVGAVSPAEIDAMLPRLRAALDALA